MSLCLCGFYRSASVLINNEPLLRHHEQTPYLQTGLQNMNDTKNQSTYIPWYRRATIWLGIGLNPASISLGGGLAAQLPLWQLLIVVPIGVLLLTVIATANGILARHRRETFSQCMVTTFGRGIGSNFLNLTMAAGMIGWGGFHTGISGASVADLLHLPVWSGALILVLIIFVLNEVGVNRWALFLWVTTLSTFGLTLFALVAVDISTALTTTASASSTSTIDVNLWLWVIGTILAYASLFALRSGDFSWEMASDADVAKVNLWLSVSLLIAIGVGALLYQATGNWNIADILARVQSAALGQLFLVIAVASPLLSGLHSGILAIERVSLLSRRQSAVLICTVIFIFGALRFDQRLLGFLEVVGAILPPALAVILVAALQKRRPASWITTSAWLAGAAVASVIMLQGLPTHIIIGALVSTILLVILSRVRPSIVERESRLRPPIA